MTQQAVNEGKEPRKDYSGLLTVEKEAGKSAQEYIDDFEKRAGAELVKELWQRTNDAAKFSLRTIQDAGLINKSLFNELAERYNYYIPLRGHDAVTAEDLWKYFPEAGTYFSKPIIQAEGRTSRSETPFAYILQMAQSAIVSANKNILNQTLLRLARLDTTGLLTANRTWYVNGIAQEAEYSEDADTYRENIEKFEEEMEEKEKQGLAERKKGRLNVGDLFIEPAHREQHAVHVFQNGKAYTIHINGNPAVSQAINGLNLYGQNKDYSRVARATRWMAANMTTRNPLFVASNFSRDYIFTSSILGVKEDAKYALQFQGNIPKASAALYRYLAGKPDLNKAADRYMLEYIMNGAKTGFSHIVNLQKIQKQVERDIKNGNRKNMINHLSDAVGNMNDFAENLSRFSVYLTSRKAGRSVNRAVSDAKEVTVNFNRQGAGGYGAAWIRPLYLFVNAGVQAFSNYAKVAVKHPWKTAALVTTYSASGAIIMPLLAALIGGDEGEDEYWRLTDWDRQNNLCIYTGKGFIKIPLPHELRVFHALGDNIAQAMLGKKTGGDAFLDSMLSFTDLIPTNPAGSAVAASKDLINKGGSEAAKTAISLISPDFAKPFVQLGANRDFKGMQVVNPRAKNTLPGYKKIRINKKGEAYAPSFLVDFAKLTDYVTGGDGVRKGVVSFNPDVAQHLMGGYFGGLYTTISQTADMIYRGILPDEDVKLRNTPLRRFYVSGDDISPIGQGENSMYRHIQDKVSEDKALMKGYNDEAGKIMDELDALKADAANGKLGIMDFAAKQTKLNERIKEYEEEYNKLGTDKHYEMDAFISEIKKMEERLDELQVQEQKDLEIEIAGLKREIIRMSEGE
ncbi:MAG: hypothetical protein LBU37_08515 [Tannerellaceae bacterium]|nr:hypothetical protein [Tannerellaceae bacterium]